MASLDSWVQSEDWVRVMSWCEAQLAADPFAPEPLRLCARAAYELGRYDVARDAVGRLVAPGSPEVAIDALCQAFTGHPEAALRELAEWETPTAEVHAAAGLILLATGQLDAARTAFHAAVTLDPSDATAHHGLAWVLESTSPGADRSSIYAHLDAACARSPNPQYRQTRGVALLSDGQAERALEEFRAALAGWEAREHTRKDAFLAEAHGNIACSLCRLGRLDEAVREVAAALESLPTNLRAAARRRFRDDEDLALVFEREDFRKLVSDVAGLSRKAGDA